jgi:hypothetical protein
MVYAVGSGTDHLHQCRRDRGVEPRRDTLVDLQPLSIVSHGASIDRAINVVDDAELVKSGVEEDAPGRERGVAVVKLNRDMRANVDMLYVSDGERFWELATEEVGLEAMVASEREAAEEMVGS